MCVVEYLSKFSREPVDIDLVGGDQFGVCIQVSLVRRSCTDDQSILIFTLVCDFSIDVGFSICSTETAHLFIGLGHFLGFNTSLLVAVMLPNHGDTLLLIQLLLFAVFLAIHPLLLLFLLFFIISIVVCNLSAQGDELIVLCGVQRSSDNVIDLPLLVNVFHLFVSEVFEDCIGCASHNCVWNFSKGFRHDRDDQLIRCPCGRCPRAIFQTFDLLFVLCECS